MMLGGGINESAMILLVVYTFAIAGVASLIGYGFIRLWRHYR